MPASLDTAHTLAEIAEQGRGLGLVLRGGFVVNASDNIPDLEDGPAASLVLFGNAGSSIWPDFSASTEYADGKPDPLNRWSERIGNKLAKRWCGRALFPFGGPPYQPFLGWAKKAENLRSSQLGLLMHPQYGLWHAYRFAIALSYQPEGIDQQIEESHACDRCEQKPCLGGCPVNAFTEEGYDVARCFQFLQQHPEAACHSQGCQARSACPEGTNYRYLPDHAAFHMEKFTESLAHRFNQQD